jgi:O-antigen/teichoic acid export membrane protein
VSAAFQPFARKMAVRLTPPEPMEPEVVLPTLSSGPAPAPEFPPAKPQRSVIDEFKTLLRQSSHYLFGLISSLALGFISFPLFTRMFSVADYGTIDLVQKVVFLAVAFGKAGMQNSTLRFFNHEVFEVDPEARKRYYSTMFYSVLGISFAVTLVYVAALQFLPATFVDRPLASILTFTCALVVTRSLQSILFGFLRIEEKTKAYNVAGFIIKAATIVAVLGLVRFMGTSVKTYYAATIGIELATVAAVCYPLLRRGLLNFTKFDTTLLKAGLAFGLPMIIQELAGNILDSGDRWLVRMYLGADALGYYSVAYGLSGYVNTLIYTPLWMAVLPIYMRIWRSQGKEKTREFLSIGMDAFLILAGALFVLATVGAHDAVVFMASPKYKVAAPLIPTLVAGLLLYTVQVFLNAGLLIQKKTKLMAASLAGSAILNIGLNMLLLPKMGIQGAAVATLISYGVCTLVLAILSSRVLSLDFYVRSFIGYVIAALVTVLAIPYIDTHSAFWNLLVKSSLALVLYGGMIYVTDGRVRGLVGQLWNKVRSRLRPAQGAA